MNPGLVVKLRPAGPWRIGPDSGARNRVDAIYHSDSLYSAVAGAMVRLGWLEEWLDATARTDAPAVSFSSCFPFLDEIGFVVPPRTVWPPSSPALMSARVRWKSARFVPLGLVQAILAGKRLDESQWAVDGDSQCLVPAGRPGPFRSGVRWNAGVDRLTGASERFSTACLEFRPGAGLWTVVSFRDEAARDRWREPVKAAFRYLADTGMGGERSRGWGRAEAPEFAEGLLPDLILPGVEKAAEIAEAMAAQPAPREIEPVVAPAPVEPEPPAEMAPAEPDGSAEPAAAAPAPAPEAEAEPAPAPEPAPEPAELPAALPEPVAAAEEEPEAGNLKDGLPAPAALKPHWLLSVFTPGPSDSVDWKRGNYSLVARGGRVESPAGSGELKKQLQMLAEGSVIHAATAPCGAATDVAPDGFAHPVFRAGFAVSIPLPEVS